MSELESILFAYEEISRTGRVAALASVVSVGGSTYRRIGAHMLITDGGEVTGAYALSKRRRTDVLKPSILSRALSVNL